MAAEIKLTKTDESPWGFRLTGGRDFGTPLTIIKVAVNSVAEEAGLQVGDILVKINEIDCPPLTHKEAQDIILQSQNSVTFSVLRGSLSLSEDVFERLTPLPLRDFKTPEPTIDNRPEQPALDDKLSEPTIEVIPIEDLEPELLEELGLNPLPEDFLDRAKRDPSPMPEVRPQSRMTSPIDVLEALEELGLKDVVEEIERQKEIVFQVPSVEQKEDVVFAAEVSADKTPVEPATEDTLPLSQPEVQETGTELNISQLPSERDTCSNKTVEAHGLPISGEEFAEFISGQEEVLEVEGKNALGVDFSKFEPTAEFIRKSQVFKTLQDSEKILSREEKDRKWTTFLDKPKGPKPKPKPKPRSEPQPQCATVECQPKLTPEPEQVQEPRKSLYEIPSEEEFATLVRLPTPTIVELSVEPVQTEIQEESEGNGPNLQGEGDNLQEELENEKQFNLEKFGEGRSEIELQLEEIQRQLQAIQQLPFEIQQHLTLVQKQLNELVHQRLREQEEGANFPPGPRPSMVDPFLLEQFQRTDECQQLSPLEESIQEAEEQQEKEIDASAAEIAEEEVKKEFKLRTEEEPPILPPPKKERLRKKRPFLGLGPAPRPLILPGGRRWRTPKDAYNDEFIAETLSAQAEIITGTTLGYEPKAPNLVHLRDSTVYKMIHDLEDPDVVNRGMASRPEIVPALQDFAKQPVHAAI